MKIIKFIIGILSVPIAFAVTASFYNNMALVKDLSARLHFFLWGVASYAALHLLFFKPTYLYVLGHEAVHAGTAWLFGGRIKSFKVSEKGGSVSTDKTNAVIELSPYFVPIYAILICVVYFIIASSYNIDGSFFVFLIGFALAFHVISTIEVMKIRQPDIVKSGYIFSIVLVYTLNIIIIACIFALLFTSFSLKKFFFNSWNDVRMAYVSVVKQLFF